MDKFIKNSPDEWKDAKDSEASSVFVQTGANRLDVFGPLDKVQKFVCRSYVCTFRDARIESSCR